MTPHNKSGRLRGKSIVAISAAALTLAMPRVVSGECVAPGPARSGLVTQVRFRILESFKGTPGRHVDLMLQPSSEEFPYVKGQLVLVYAKRIGEMWSTACTRTRQTSPTDTEPQIVRALQAREPGGVVDGSVATAELLRTGRAGGIAVVLRRGGALVSELQTDGAGRFQTGWLAPGAYELSVKATTPATANPRRVVVARDSGCLSIGMLAHQ